MAEYKIGGSFVENDELVEFLNSKSIANSTKNRVLTNEMDEEISDDIADGTGESGDPNRVVNGANYYMTIDLSRDELASVLEEAVDYLGSDFHLY